MRKAVGMRKKEWALMRIRVPTCSNEDAIGLARLHQDPQGLVTEGIGDEHCDYIQPCYNPTWRICRHFITRLVRYSYLSVFICICS
jgi:hypothetical protein